MPCTDCPVHYVDEMLLNDFQDDGFYHLSCPKGHETTVRLQNQKFELLFDSGGLALIDGYFYESVSSIASALERFMEFYVKVITLKHLTGNIPWTETLTKLQARQPIFDPLQQTWNRVAKQSERQLGAFFFVYLLENGRPPPFVDEYPLVSYKKKPLRSFRNDVIHNGYVPSRDQVVEYGEHVFQFIRQVFSELKVRDDNAIQLFVVSEMTKDYIKRQKVPNASQVIPTMLSMVRPLQEGPQNFADGLKLLHQDVRMRAYS